MHHNKLLATDNQYSIFRLPEALTCWQAVSVMGASYFGAALLAALGGMLGQVSVIFSVLLGLAALLVVLAGTSGTGVCLTDLARDAHMTKQAMAQAVSQCVAWGLVEQRVSDTDRRAQLILFTPMGLTWLGVYGDAVAQAENEFRQQVGAEVATVVMLGLEAYTSGS